MWDTGNSPPHCAPDPPTLQGNLTGMAINPDGSSC